jgi:hypothetical protein
MPGVVKFSNGGGVRLPPCVGLSALRIGRLSSDRTCGVIIQNTDYSSAEDLFGTADLTPLGGPAAMPKAVVSGAGWPLGLVLANIKGIAIATRLDPP